MTKKAPKLPPDHPYVIGGQRLRTLRKAAGLTTIELGVELGWDRTTITKHETAEKLAGRDLLKALSERFGVPFGYFLGEALASEGSKADEGKRERAIIATWRGAPEEDRQAIEAFALSLAVRRRAARRRKRDDDAA